MRRLRANLSFDAAALGALACSAVVVLAAAMNEGQAPLRGSTTSIANALCIEHALHDKISGSVSTELSRKGYVVLDGLLSAAELKQIAQDVGSIQSGTSSSWMNDHPLLADSPNADSLVRTDKMCFLRHDASKYTTSQYSLSVYPNSADLAKRRDVASLNNAIALLRGVANALDRRAFHGFDEQSTQVFPLVVPDRVQLSIYGGNGSFYIAHRDGVTGSFVQLGLLQWLKLKCYRLRVVTAILYLNESEPRTWNQASDGGSLRLYIGADKGDTLGDTAEDIVDVLPIGGRLVLFDSQQVLHEVRPVYRERIAITCWLTCPG